MQATEFSVQNNYKIFIEKNGNLLKKYLKLYLLYDIITIVDEVLREWVKYPLFFYDWKNTEYEVVLCRQRK